MPGRRAIERRRPRDNDINAPLALFGCFIEKQATIKVLYVLFLFLPLFRYLCHPIGLLSRSLYHASFSLLLPSQVLTSLSKTSCGHLLTSCLLYMHSVNIEGAIRCQVWMQLRRTILCRYEFVCQIFELNRQGSRWLPRRHSIPRAIL